MRQWDHKINQQRSKKLEKRKQRDQTYNKKHVRKWEQLVEQGILLKKNKDTKKTGNKHSSTFFDSYIMPKRGVGYL